MYVCMKIAFKPTAFPKLRTSIQLVYISSLSYTVHKLLHEMIYTYIVPDLIQLVYISSLVTKFINYFMQVYIYIYIYIYIYLVPDLIQLVYISSLS